LEGVRGWSIRTLGPDGVLGSDDDVLFRRTDEGRWMSVSGLSKPK